MYVAVRQDIDLGYQAVQAGHAAIQFQHDHPEIAKSWHDWSKYLVYVSARDEQHLKDLIFKSEIRNISTSIFTEPDIDDQITAVAFEPSIASTKLLSNLPLAFKSHNILT